MSKQLGELWPSHNVLILGQALQQNKNDMPGFFSIHNISQLFSKLPILFDSHYILMLKLYERLLILVAANPISRFQSKKF